jgi:TolB protein
MVSELHAIAVLDPIVHGESPWLAADAKALREGLAHDLAWSGFYRVAERAALPAHWEDEGSSPAETRRLVWQAAGVFGVVKLWLAPSKTEADLAVGRIRLVEVESDGVVDLPEGTLRFRPGEGRRAASAWVNALIAHDTGLAGVLGTRLVSSVQVAPGVKEVFRVPLDGSAPVALTHNGSLNLSPAWSPAGRVGYMSYRSRNADWVVDGEPFSTRPGLNMAGAWSPDGRYLALAVAEGENTDLVLLGGDDGREQARLTDHPGVDTSPAWAPDSGRLVFVSDRTGSPQIWTLSLRDGELGRITHAGYTTSPDWSPNGFSIAYCLQVAAGRFTILRHDLDTGQTERLTPPTGSAESPTFSGDGRYLAYAWRVGDLPAEIWVMHADGSHARRALSESSPWSFLSPDWERLPLGRAAR